MINFALFCFVLFCCVIDLKPDNIVLDRPGLGGILKIVDFGDALLIPNDDPKWATHSAIGTIYYVPPEIDEIRNGPTLKKGDMWYVPNNKKEKEFAVYVFDCK